MISSRYPRESELIAELCKQFYTLNWVTGTGGGISLRRCGNSERLVSGAAGDDFGEEDVIFIAPSGVQKERLQPEDIFVYSLTSSKYLYQPISPKGTPLKPSQCLPLFQSCYDLRENTRACIHTHSINAVMVTLLLGDTAKELRISHLEMIKGIRRGESKANYDYHDELVVPIIENTPYEYQLKEMLDEAIKNYPETNAILVRRHGVYVWGESWEKAKTMTECYDYIFECFVKMHQLGLNTASVINPARKPNDI